MKTTLLTLLTAVCCLFSWQVQAQQVQAVSGIQLPTPTPYAFTVPNAQAPGFAPVGCGQDTVGYAFAKATGLRTININLNTAQAVSQYFDAPQPITISGFRFFAFSITAPTVNVTAELYLAGADSMPTGLPLASAVLPVDSTFGGGALANLLELANWTPVTVTQPYVLVVSNSSSNGIGLVCNDFSATPGDGRGEFLASLDLGGTWTRGYNVTLGGPNFDADWIFEPFVTHDLNTSFSASPTCLSSPNQTVNFTYGSSNILSNRMYNQAAFVGQPNLSSTWNFGDGSPSVNANSTSHVYATPGTYNVMLTDTLFGWTTICTNDSLFNIGTATTASFTASSSGFSANFNNTTPGAISQSWSFGDGNASTAANPNHVYASAGTYTVCLTSTDICGSSTTCNTITILAPGACPADTIEYTLAKATGLQFLDINNATSAQAIGQYFNAPQPITVYGFEFFGWADSLPSVTITCELRSVGLDSLPTGPALASTTFSLDSVFGGGTLNDLSRYVGFPTPVTVTGPYVITVTNASPNGVNLISNNYSSGDGQQEWLGSVDLFGTWTPGYGVNVGGSAFDADWLIYPLVDYDIQASFNLFPPCLSGPGTVTFNNASSPIFADRMYNRAAFQGIESFSYTWNFGDGSPTVKAIDTTHFYSAAGNYTVTLSDTIFGWTTFCFDDTTAQIGASSQASFTSSTSGLTATFTNTTTGITGQSWDFGDGNTSTQANPTHTYASPGSYNVCLTTTDQCGSTTTCEFLTFLAPSTCGADTVQYPLGKATGLQFLNINNTSSAQAVGQYYNAPQPITIYGFEFFGWSDSLPVVNVTCEVRAIGADSLPTGPALASTTFALDSVFGGGSLGELSRYVGFATPPTVTGPYVITVTNPSPANVNLVSSSYTSGDGQQEWLGSADLFGTWTPGYALNVGGSAFDADWLMYPLVTYDLQANFTPSQACLGSAGNVAFTNASSPILGDRMYNRAVFQNLTALSYTWDFGDGSPQVNAVDTNHTYATGGPFTVALTDTIFGWTSLCTADTTMAILAPPAAAFTSSTSSLNVTFTDATTGSPTSWLWDFGDGNTSTQQNPTHAYSVPGTYTVCLVATNSCGSDSSCASVTVSCAAPNAAFTSSVNLLTATFTDNSTGTNISGYLWDFGDGNTSTLQSPSHTYSASGTYTVCLTVTDLCGTDSTCSTVTVTCPAPNAAFSTSTNVFSATFTDNSTGTMISGYLWDFGDGNTSTLQNPTHTYAMAGTYTVCLTVTDMCGTDSTCQSVAITCPAPGAAFSSSVNLLTANFTDNSTGSMISSYAWDFGDGNTSTQQSPSHTYTNPGTYTVCLVVTDMCGNDTTCSSVTVTCPAPGAAFSSSTSMLTATFTDNSTGNNINGYFWSFGDGNSSTLQNPSHTYATPGTYTVCLVVSDTCGTDSSCAPVTVVCPAPSAAFSSSSNLLTANFTDNSTGNMITSHAWDFGDGNTSTQQSPTHTYAASGTYTVCLIVTDMCGNDTTCNQVTINCPAPSAAFSSSTNLLTATFTDNSSGNSINSYVWDFGDGNTSTMQNPSHTYTMGGSYTVCLVVTDICGSDTSCQTIAVNCPAPQASFTFTNNNLTYDFIDASTAVANASWAWDFGDGNTSTMQSPSHTYAAPGTYTVCLVLTDSCGSDTSCQALTVVNVEDALDERVDLYPNPAQDRVQIALDLAATEDTDVRIFNALGELVKSFRLEGVQRTNFPVDLTTFSDGTYMFEFRIGDRRVVKRLNVVR